MNSFGDDKKYDSKTKLTQKKVSVGEREREREREREPQQQKRSKKVQNNVITDRQTDRRERETDNGH